MIHARDGGFGVASLWPEGGLRRVSGPSQGAERQYRHGGFRSVRLRHVFHAERVLPLFPADAGEGARALELPNPVRDREDPSDNYIRDMLDGADPALLAPCFRRTEQLLLEPAMREAFGRLSGRTLIALDGTEYFCSQKITCPHCQTRKRSNGKIESYHSLLAATVVAPGHSKVVPLAPEFIVKQDGAEKQDCERNAAKRWLDKHGARLKPLRPVYLGDDLFACQSVVERLADNGDDFLFTCKEASHKALYDFIDGCELDRHEIKVRKGKPHEIHRYRFIGKVPLRDGKDAVLVNWIGFEILNAKGVVKYR